MGEPAGRYALVVATARYEDPKLRRLRSPETDAERLAAVLGDPEKGNFDVDVLLDPDHGALTRRLAVFFKDRRPSDLLLLHFSCHGVKDESGELYLAACDTEVDLLSATGVSAAWLKEQINRTRSKSTVLLLDCCFSGLFPFGFRARAAGDFNAPEQLEGRGRAVVTASSEMEYAHEGDELSGEGEPSVFTEAVVEGLETGKADLDQDHLISIDDLYGYVYSRVKERKPHQTPNKKVELEGTLYLARSAYEAPVDPAKLDPELIALAEHGLATAREGAVGELERLLDSSDRAVVLAARQLLALMVEDDSRRVSARARTALEHAPATSPDERANQDPVMVLGDTTRLPTSPPSIPARGVAAPPEASLPVRRSGTEIRQILASGIGSVADLVAPTLGPMGQFVVLRGEAWRRRTRDGATIVRQITVANVIEQEGVELVQRMVAEIDAEGGAVTTAVVLAREIVDGVIAAESLGSNRNRLAPGLGLVGRHLVESLGNVAVVVDSREALARVASLLAGDQEIGEMIADAIDKVGRHGVVHVEEGLTFAAGLEFTEGMQIDKGYLSPDMVTDRDRMEAVLEDPYILIVDHRIGPIRELLPVVELVIESGKPLLIVADDVEGESLATLVLNKQRETFTGIAVAAPGFADRRTRVLEDIAILTGGDVILPAAGMQLENTQLVQLGRARRVVITTNATTIIGGAGAAEKIANRIAAIKSEIESIDSEYDRERLRERFEKLAGGVAVLRVGADNEIEMKEKKQRVEHAVRATQAALRGGVVPGGGAGLWAAGESLEPSSDEGEDQQGVTEILRQALARPLRQILENAGYDQDNVLGQLRSAGNGCSFDVVSGRIARFLTPDGILDPCAHLQHALTAAITIAETVLMTDTVLVKDDSEGRLSRPLSRDLAGWGPNIQVRRALAQGVRAIANALAPTLGPRGRFVVLRGESGRRRTRSGAQIAREVTVDDMIEQEGAELVRQMGAEMEARVGGGVTTAVVIAEAIVDGLVRAEASGRNRGRLARGLWKAAERAEQELLTGASGVDGHAAVARVGSLWAGDKDIGAVIADAIDKVGKHGVVTVEDGQRCGMVLEFTEGMQFDGGYISAYMVTDQERMEAVLEDPYILIANLKISSAGDLVPLLEQTVESGRPLLIVAEDVVGEALATLIVNKLRATFTGVAVKAPGFGDRRRQMLEDIAILTGGVVITEAAGLKPENTQLSQLGRARRVVLTKDTTAIVGASGEHDTIRARTGQLKTELEGTDSDSDRQRLQDRVARLSGGVAVVKVGAATKAEMTDRKHRVEDALQATRAAMEQGIVLGGGTSLWAVGKAIEPGASPSEEDRSATQILGEALGRPLRQILENAGYELDEVLRELEIAGPTHVFDVNSGTVVDAEDPRAPMDPVTVLRLAITQATSVAESVLTTSSVLSAGSVPSSAADADFGSGVSGW